MPLNNFGHVCTTFPTGYHLFRSAKPDEEGLKFVSHFLGVKTIFNLAEEDEIDGGKEQEKFNGVVYTRSFNKIFRYGDRESVAQVCKEIHNELQFRSVLIHCVHGRDRTGLICAAFKLLYLDPPVSLAQVNADRKTFGVSPLINLVDYQDCMILRQIEASRGQKDGA